MASVTATIIITTYNQAPTLRLLLTSLQRQTEKNFEVIVADDGSSDETKSLCEEAWSFPLRFVTQPDEGYRKSKILNQVIRQARGDYLIFLDGDVIVEKHFVEDHFNLRRPGHFVCGRRVDLGPEFSKNLNTENVTTGKYDGLSLALLWSGLKKDTISWKRAVRITTPLCRKLLGYDRPLDLLGSNFSAWKSDIQEVNGFNEALKAYWGEDGDLFIRLRNSGKKPIGAKSLCIQYHVFHPRRPPSKENVQMYEELLKDKEYKRAKQGLES